MPGRHFVRAVRLQLTTAPIGRQHRSPFFLNSSPLTKHELLDLVASGNAIIEVADTITRYCIKPPADREDSNHAIFISIDDDGSVYKDLVYFVGYRDDADFTDEQAETLREAIAKFELRR